MSPSDVDKFASRPRSATTVSDVIESRVQATPPAQASSLDALRSLAATIDTACEDLFAAAPFAGDQATGCSIDAVVDQVVAALRSLQGEADDLRRAMSIMQQRNAPRDEGGRP